MKKVLILAYDFPPYVSVGGLRPYSWYKHFREFGLDPVVITRQWGNKYGNHLDYIAPSESDKTIVEETEFGTIIRTPYTPNLANRIMLKYGEKRFRFVRKAISAFYEVAQFFLPVGPKVNLYKEAQNYLSKNQVDIIIATGEPFVLFNYGSRLSKRYNIPWIADYRDPWVQNSERAGGNLIKTLLGYIERRCLKNVEFVTTVSEFLIHRISEYVQHKQFYVFTNGYDEESIANALKEKQNPDILSIGYAGTIYNWHPLNHFLATINDFVQENPKMKLHINFFGTNMNAHIVQLVNEQYPLLIDVVNTYPRLPYNDVLLNLAKCNLLLLFNDYSFMGTKIFDYLALKRRIVFCFSNDREALALKRKYYPTKESGDYSKNLQVDLIQQTNSGVILENADHLKASLREFLREYSTRSEIICNSIETERYSRRAQIVSFAELLKKV